MVATSARACAVATSSSDKRAGFAAKQVEGTDDLPAQPHRDGVSSEEPGLDGDRSEARPATVDGGQVLVDDRRPDR